MRNGEGYYDPTAGYAIRNSSRKSNRKELELRYKKCRLQKECSSYGSGCFKYINGIKRICPLKGDLNNCLAIIQSDPEKIEKTYQKMFGKEEYR